MYQDYSQAIRRRTANNEADGVRPVLVGPRMESLLRRVGRRRASCAVFCADGGASRERRARWQKLVQCVGTSRKSVATWVSAAVRVANRMSHTKYKSRGGLLSPSSAASRGLDVSGDTRPWWEKTAADRRRQGGKMRRDVLCGRLGLIATCGTPTADGWENATRRSVLPKASEKGLARRGWATGDEWIVFARQEEQSLCE